MEKRPSPTACSPAQLESVAHVLRVLAHPVRLAMAAELLTGRYTVGELAERVGSPQAAVSQHLSKMRAQGLIDSDRDGQRVYYRVTHPIAESVMRCIWSNRQQVLRGQRSRR